MSHHLFPFFFFFTLSYTETLEFSTLPLARMMGYHMGKESHFHLLSTIEHFFEPLSLALNYQTLLGLHCSPFLSLTLLEKYLAWLQIFSFTFPFPFPSSRTPQERKIMEMMVVETDLPLCSQSIADFIFPVKLSI